MALPPNSPAFDRTKRHPAFFSARTKLGRAGGMIEALEQFVNAYIEENPSRLILEETKPGFCRIKIQTDQTPIDLPMLLGDILHNMRGALDHLASSVVEHANQVPDHRVNFPVHETKDQFVTMQTRKSPHQLASAAADVWQIIEETAQPWKENDSGSLIWAVSKLNNIDKHRLLLIIPFRALSPIDGLGRGISMRNNLFVLDGWGEMVFYEGPTIHLPKKEVHHELFLREESVIDKTPLIPFLKEAYNQVFGLIYAIETHMFGQDASIEST